MDAITAIKRLEWMKTEGKRCFHLREMGLLGPGESIYSIAMTLSRLRKKEIVDKCENIWFLKTEPPSLLEVARMAEPVSYLSLESALFERNVLSQSPRSATMITTGRPRDLKCSLGLIHFHHVMKKLFFGQDMEAIAEPEKALLDLIYIKRKKGVELPWDGLYLDMIDVNKLAAYGKSFPPWVYAAYEGQIKIQNEI